MNQSIRKTLILAALAAMAGGAAHGAVRSKAIVVEFPADLPELAQARTDAMYLEDTGSGQAILYLEQDQGRQLAILDVTDPANIRVVGQAAIEAPAAYDFVHDLANSASLIRYRDGSGFAVISFKNYKKPVLKDEPEYLHPASAETYGMHGLLLESAGQPSAPGQDPQYQVLGTSSSTDPVPLATIHSVRQRVDRPQTGTIFLLNDDGLTVVRCLASEREYEAWLARQKTACCH
jgi:hypothetical protein